MKFSMLDRAAYLMPWIAGAVFLAMALVLLAISYNLGKLHGGTEALRTYCPHWETSR